MATEHVAIVGSGPAGCYTAQAVLKELPGARITILERLPVPFGLIRHGVAADHQGTKAIARQFDRVLQHEAVTFVGNVHVGTDVSLDDLRAHFDAVVIATGLDRDRSLGVPGEDLPGVVASGSLTRWMNGHPDDALAVPALGRRVVVVGNGNVAMDVVRLLAKRPSDFAGTDLATDTANAIAAAGIEEIVVVGRSCIAEAKLDPAMLKELAHIDGVQVVSDVIDPSESSARADALRTLLERTRIVDNVRVTIRFRFGWTPQRIEGDTRAERITFRDPDGAEYVAEADTVITAIGFDGPAQLLSGVPQPHDGRLEEGLYCAGWARRGARGTIPDARTDARQVAKALAADLQARRSPRSDHPWPHRCLEHLDTTDYAGWLAIDRHERATATAGRTRNKITRLDALLDLAHHHATTLEGETA